MSSNLTLEYNLPMANFFKSQVLENKKINDKFHHLKFKLEGDPFDFQTGQFVVLKVGDGLLRDYSVASTPSLLPYWEMIVDVTPGGPGTTYLKTLKVGEIVETTSPRGIFIVEDDGSETVILGATGCGIASIKPMAEEILQENPQREVCLFWGLRFNNEIFLEKIFKGWKEKYPNFNFEVVLSKPETSWEGKSGHITECIKELAGKGSKDKVSVYLCGSSQMISDVKQSLAEINFPHDKIYFEKYF